MGRASAESDAQLVDKLKVAGFSSRDRNCLLHFFLGIATAVLGNWGSRTSSPFLSAD